MSEPLPSNERILDAISQWVVLYDADLRIVDANDAALEALARPRGDVLGSRLRDLRLPKQVVRDLEAEIEACFGDGERRTGTFELAGPTDSRWFHYQLKRLLGPTGRPFVVSSKSEITEYRKLSREVEHFTAGVAHDIKSPLLGIMFRADAIREEMDALTDETSLAPFRDEVAEHLDHVIRAAENLTSLADDILAHARAGQMDADIDDHDLRDSIEAAAARLEDRIEMHAAELHVTHDGEPLGRADPDLLVQVWQNLIENSLRYRTEQAPHIRIHIQPTTDGHLEVAIEDNGVGVRPEMRERIFQPFLRGPHERGSGSGLGLAHCRRLLEVQQGTIHNEARDGGARFIIRLPSAKGSLEPTTAPSQGLESPA